MAQSIEQMQVNILTGIFGGRDKEAFKLVLDSDLKEWSKPSYNFLWKKALRYYYKADEIISWSVFKSLLSKANIKDSLKKLYLMENKKLFDRSKYKKLKKEGIVKYSIKELNAIKRNNDFFNIAKDLAVKINTGQVEDLDDELDNVLGKLVADLVSKKQPDYSIIDYGQTFTERQNTRKLEKYNPDKYKKFYYKYKDLSTMISKGHRGGDLIIVSGITGVGKSIWSIDTAISAAEQGLKTAFIISENTVHQVAGRLDANITNYEYDIIQAYGFDNDKEVRKFEKLYNKKIETATRIKIVKVAPNNFSVLTILRALNELKSKKFDPDVLIIDSPDLMRPSVDNIKIGGEHYGRLSKTAVYWEIKGMAVDLNKIVFCTSQLIRDVSKRKDPLTANAEDIADSYDKVRISDVMLILLETIDLVLNHQIAVKIAKHRDGKTSVEPIILRADKSKMTFYNNDGSPINYPQQLERAIVNKLKDEVNRKKQHNKKSKKRNKVVKLFK